MNKPNHTPESISEIKRQRIASRNIIIAMALLLVALLVGSGTSDSPKGDLSMGDILWAGLSIVAFASLLGSLFIAYKQADERQRLIQLKATSLTCVVIVLALVAAQILYTLDVVNLNIALQVIVAGAILLWMTVSKSIERRSN